MSEKEKSLENDVKDIDIESGEIDSKKLGVLTAQVMNNPEVLAAMQSRLSGMIGMPSGYYETLSDVVKRRVKALKKLQLEKLKIDAECCREAYELEVKHAMRKTTLYEKRHDIISGKYEPNDEECDFPSDVDDEEDDEKLSEEVKEKVNVKEDKDENVKGIPDFWLIIFKNVDLIAENIQEHDEPILAHLKDVNVIHSFNPMKFTLEFHFTPNEFFANEILTKEYDFKCEPDPNDPWSFDGLNIVKCKGCKIEWKKGKNVTEKTVVKKQKHKSKAQVRTVTKTVKNDSFFNFFDPPQVPENEEDIDEDTEALIQADYEIGEVIRTSIIPRAVLFFTGEALDEDDYEDEDEEDEEGDDDEDSDADEDYSPPKQTPGGKGHGGKGHGGKHSNRKLGSEEKPPECKQQ